MTDAALYLYSTDVGVMSLLVAQAFNARRDTSR